MSANAVFTDREKNSRLQRRIVVRSRKVRGSPIGAEIHETARVRGRNREKMQDPGGRGDETKARERHEDPYLARGNRIAHGKRFVQNETLEPGPAPSLNPSIEVRAKAHAKSPAKRW